MNATIIPAPVPARAPVPTQPSPLTLVPNPNAADGRGSVGVSVSGLGADAVDAILAACVADGQSNLYADLTGCAAPSAAGLASKATLESRGWKVYVASSPPAPPPPPSPGLVYEFPAGGLVRNRFSGGASALKPTEYTISAWVKPSQAAVYQAIITRSGAVFDDPIDNVTRHLRQGPRFMALDADQDSGTVLVTGTTPVVPGAWVHVAITCKANDKLRLYVNGHLDGTPVDVTDLVLFGQVWWIAGATISSGYYEGRLADVAIWKVQLSDSEVLALSSPVRGLPATTQPGELLIYCPMNDFADGVPVTTDWLDTVGTSSQNTQNSPIGRADPI